MAHMTFENGIKIPEIGYGTGTTWFKSGDSDELDTSLIEATKTAISLGYRHIDAAEVYGTEPELGIAIRECDVPRSQLFITTKVLTGVSDIHGALDASLSKLGLEYVDLYLIHAPFFASTPKELQLAWATMEELHASGKAKSIGVSNCLVSHLQQILETATIKPAVNQIEFHPHLQQVEVVAFCKRMGITVEAFAPLTALTKVKDLHVLESLKELSGKYGVSENVIMLRWVLDQGIVVITTSGSMERLKDYLTNVSTFSLTEKEIKTISSLGSKVHLRQFFESEFAASEAT